MFDVQQALIVLVVAFGATLLSAMSGGGSSLVSTPTWLLLGFPLPLALATNELAGSFWTLVAARNYLRGHQLDWRLVTVFTVCGMVGAFFGARVVIGCDPKIIQKIIGSIIVGLVIFMFLRKDFGLEATEPKVNRFFTGLTGLPLGFYEAFFGSGNGMFICAVLTHSRGFTFRQALGYSYILSFPWCLFAAGIYIFDGHWNLSLMIPAIIGSLCGGLLGSHIAVKNSVRFGKYLFMGVGTILGLKLIIF